MNWDLWNTLLRPDYEERQNPERTEISRAANYLQIGEFQLLQLAYNEWYGEDLPESAFDKLFCDYMIHGEVAFWARHYARQINRLSEQGRIAENNPRYHRYDHNYHISVPNGRRKFMVACGCLILFLGGGLFMANSSIKESATMFPPYLNTEDLPRISNPHIQSPDGTERGEFGRADSLRLQSKP